MLLVETPSNTTTPAIPRASNFRLRIHSDGASQELVNLRPGKNTIGSSPRCDIRIQQSGVQPLHCLILFNDGRLAARRWAAGTRLNGHPFDEAPLGPGDRLAIGDIELEVVAAEVAANVVAAEVAANKGESAWSEATSSAADQAALNTSPTPYCESWGEWSPSHPTELSEVRTESGASERESAWRETTISPKVEPASNQPNASSFESWDEWSSSQPTELSEVRQDDASPQSSPEPDVLPAHQAAWQKRCGTQHEGDDRAKDQLAVIPEPLSEFEEKLASWKDAREDWQRERTEWHAERELSRRQWTEVESQIAELQSRASEIIRRIERLEHSMAAQALVPKFEAARAIVQQLEPPSEPQADSLAQLQPALDPIPDPINPFAGRAMPEMDVAAEPSDETDDELAPFAEFSIWRQGATDATNAGYDAPEADDPKTQSETSLRHASAMAQAENAWQIAPARSFIEQYGHMFADDGVDAEQPSGTSPSSADTAQNANDESIIRQSHSPGGNEPDVGVPPESTNDEEESIEQYMSKLLQRVRGESPVAGGAQGASGRSSTPATGWSSGAQSVPETSVLTSASHSEGTAFASEVPRAGAQGEWLTTSLGTVRRKAAMVEQPADLKRLRAVANESARRAISTHGLRVHRRNAITKVIVSTLAGMTSLFMMLDAPHWQDLQFITACVSLIVAAYWAGQTYAELIDAFRAAAYDGPEDKLQGLAKPLSTGIPKRVESSAKS